MKKRRSEDKKQNGTKVWSAALALLAAEVSIFVVRSKQLIVDNFFLHFNSRFGNRSSICWDGRSSVGGVPLPFIGVEPLLNIPVDSQLLLE